MSAPEKIVQRPLGPRPLQRPPPPPPSACMGALACIEKSPPSPGPLVPGADPKLLKSLAGDGRDPGRKGGAQPAGGAVSPKLDWNPDLPLGGDTESRPRRRREEEEEEGGGRGGGGGTDRQAELWTTRLPGTEHLLCPGGWVNAQTLTGFPLNLTNTGFHVGLFLPSFSKGGNRSREGK